MLILWVRRYHRKLYVVFLMPGCCRGWRAVLTNEVTVPPEFRQTMLTNQKGAAVLGPGRPGHSLYRLVGPEVRLTHFPANWIGRLYWRTETKGRSYSRNLFYLQAIVVHPIYCVKGPNKGILLLLKDSIKKCWNQNSFVFSQNVFLATLKNFFFLIFGEYYYI